MNSRDKYEQNKERFELLKQKQNRLYYLQRKLKAKNIAYISRKKIIFPTSDNVSDVHVKHLQTEFNYTVQTIIE